MAAPERDGESACAPQSKAPRRQSQVHSFAVAFAGIGRAVRSEPHMRAHLCLAAAALAACGVLRVDAIGWALVVLCIGAVLSLELVNTALEALCDKVSPEYDELVKVAKDAAAGAVLVVAVMSVAVGLVVFVPALLRLM